MMYPMEKMETSEKLPMQTAYVMLNAHRYLFDTAVRAIVTVLPMLEIWLTPYAMVAPSAAREVTTR